MNYLSHTRCYLSGAIEHCESKFNWRDEPKKILKEQFNVHVFDPFDDPKQNFVSDLKIARENKDFEKMRKIARGFVRKDLAVVDRTDYIIAYLPYKVSSVGTHHEIINSNNSKKPCLLVCPQGKEFIPIWYYGFIKLEFMFGSWDELFNYLKEVNDGLHKDNNRWNFVYGLV